MPDNNVLERKGYIMRLIFSLAEARLYPCDIIFSKNFSRHYLDRLCLFSGCFSSYNNSLLLE